METFEPLIGVAKTGKDKLWIIKVEDLGSKGAKIITTHGSDGGKQTEASRIVEKGKNIGKANETTAFEQALKEAKSKWVKKTEEGYKVLGTDKTSTSTNEVLKTKNRSVLPMLALDFKKRGHNIDYPCFVQPKLDGVRCVYTDEKLYSRNSKEFTSINHIVEELSKAVGMPGILDGEMYSTKMTFQNLVGLVKKKKLVAADQKTVLDIKYVIYDLVSKDDYAVRMEKLHKFFKENKFKYIELIVTEEAKNEGQLQQFHDKYIEKGFEGLMARNKLGSYEEKNRSKNLQKFKMFIDGEYEIIGITEGDGIEVGCVIYICKTLGGKEFKVRPHGSHEERKKLFKIGSKLIGKMLTVKYFELSPDLVPRFPTTLHGGTADIRDWNGIVL